MSGFNKGASLWAARAIGACLVLGMCVFASGRVAAQQAESAPWVVPPDAKKVKNPFPPTPETLAAGQQLFTDNCVLCHGEKGIGDGPGAKAIKVKPANFTDREVDGRGNGRLAVLENDEWPRSDALLEGHSHGQGTLGTGGLHSQADKDAKK